LTTSKDNFKQAW